MPEEENTPKGLIALEVAKVVSFVGVGALKAGIITLGVSAAGFIVAKGAQDLIDKLYKKK